MPLRATLLLTFLLLTLVALLFLAEASQASTARRFELEPSVLTATEGYLNLAWQAPDSRATSTASAANSPPGMVLQLALQPDFAQLFNTYPLTDQSQISLSGLPDGDYFARLVVAGQTQAGVTSLSNVASFRVQHRNLNHAWLLFAVGCTLFALLLLSLRLLQKKFSANGTPRDPN